MLDRHRVCVCLSEDKDEDQDEEEKEEKEEKEGNNVQEKEKTDRTISRPSPYIGERHSEKTLFETWESDPRKAHGKNRASFKSGKVH